MCVLKYHSREVVYTYDSDAAACSLALESNPSREDIHCNTALVSVMLTFFGLLSVCVF